MRNFLLVNYVLSVLLLVVPAWADQPSARTASALAALPDGSLLLFGGLDEEGNVLGDTWVFSPSKGEAWIELFPTDAPAPRHGHRMIALPDGTVMMFGGENVQAELMNDLHHFTNSMWESEDTTGPLPPVRADCAMWPNGSLTYIFGGRGESGDLDDLWAYDPDAGTWAQKASASNPAAGAAVGAAATLVYVLGYSGTTPMYAYENDQWFDMPFGHEDLILRTMAANAGNDCHASLYGGTSLLKDGAVLDDAWLFDFETAVYTQLADLPFAVTGAAAAIVGEGTEEMVFLFGGELTDGSLNDTLLAYNVLTDDWDEPDVTDDDDDDDDDSADDDDNDNDDNDDNDDAVTDDDDDDNDDGCGC